MKRHDAKKIKVDGRATKMKRPTLNNQEKKILLISSVSMVLGFMLLILNSSEFFAFFAAAALLMCCTNPKMLPEAWYLLFNLILFISLIAVFANKMYITGVLMIVSIIYTYSIDKEKLRNLIRNMVNVKEDW